MYKMTIPEAREKCKKYLTGIPQDVLLVTILILACSLSFGLGYLAGKDAGQGSQASLETSPLVASSTSQVVASKNGTKYYYPWCAGVDRITDANKIWFDSASVAQTQGYAPASNCKGL